MNSLHSRCVRVCWRGSSQEHVACARHSPLQSRHVCRCIDGRNGRREEKRREMNGYEGGRVSERERRQSLLRFWRTDRLRKFYRFFICCKDKGSVFAAENWISLTESVLKESKNFEAEVCIFLLLLFSPSAAAVAVSQSLLDSGRSKSY